MADTASNVITGNGGDGINVGLGSSVRLGRRNAPDSCGNNPNSTNPNNLNAGIGIDCQSLSAIDGVLGTLNGAEGPSNLRDLNSDCPDCCFASVDREPPSPENEAPEAAFSFETDGLTANFSDESTDSDGDVAAWSWDFGDGDGTSTEPNPSYTYAEEGTYTVTLTVTDDQGAESEPAEDSVAVSAPPSDGVVQVFATRTTIRGFKVGGLAGADALCQEEAADAGLGGTWTAWLSTDDTDARDRIPDGEYQLVDGTVIAEDKGDLTDGFLRAPINLDQSGEEVGGPAWTGTLPDGTGAADNCSNWTDDPNANGVHGNSTNRNGTWTVINEDNPADCNGTSADYRLYCFGGGQ